MTVISDIKTVKIQLALAKIMTKNIRNNNRKKILLLGRTGAGKSSLGNVLAGLPCDSDLFPVSAGCEGCTHEIRFADEFFNGDTEKPISLIDTIGFEDPDRSSDDIDEKNGIITELLIKLRDYCDHVNLFLLVINGDNPRIDRNLIEMIKIFEGMFGERFWSQVVIVFTKLHMDERSKNMFRRTSGGKTYDEFAINYLSGLQRRFPSAVDLKYVLLDAYASYEDSSVDEKEAFNSAIEKLRGILDQAPPLSTSEVGKVVDQKIEELEECGLGTQLKNMLTEKDKMLEDLTKMQYDAVMTIEGQFESYNSSLKVMREKNQINEQEYTRLLQESIDFKTKAIGELSGFVDQKKEEVIKSRFADFKFKNLGKHIWDILKSIIAGIIAKIVAVFMIPAVPDLGCPTPEI